MKIASFAFRSYPAKGGVEYHQKMISEYFAKKGNEITIYTSSNKEDSEYLNINLRFPFFHPKKKRHQFKNAERINDIKYIRFDIKFRFYNYNYMQGLYAAFEEEVKEYDVVHLHGLNTYNNYRLAKIAHKNNIPVILTCHDTIIADNYPLIAKWLKKLYDITIIKKLNRYVDFFILNTVDQITDLTKLGINQRKIGVIPVGIDTERMKINQAKEEKILEKYGLSKKNYLFNIGRIEEYKGIQDILYVARQLPKLKFIIAGKDQGYLRQLQEIQKKEALSNVYFIGEIDDTEKKILLKNSRIFLFPSKREGWGIVMVEAMSYGIPCIAYNIKNIRTVFRDQKSGILIRDKSELKKAIESLLNNNMWKKYSLNSKKEAAEYDYRKLFPKVEKIYKNIKKT